MLHQYIAMPSVPLASTSLRGASESVLPGGRLAAHQAFRSGPLA